MVALVDARGRLSGRPAGWYALAFSGELGAGATVRRQLLERALVVSRTPSGTPVVSDAGRPSRRHPVCERHGVVLAFSEAGEAGEPAPWPLRAIEPEHATLAWSSPTCRTWRIRTQPQEIIENTVDIAHFTVVHGYREIEVTAPFTVDGPHLTMGYVVTRDRGLLGKYDPSRLRMRLDITASGLGYSRVEVSGLPLRLRTVVMPTPVDRETTEVRVVTQVALAGRRGAGARLIAGTLGRAVGRIAAAEMGRDFAADIRIWEHKRYQDPPRLVAGDGPIGPYRTWARQFYRSRGEP
jgi:3-ketosteroid 9alpha-hydroxylase-like protein